jgi:pimeloyl-ACP methyl ester carboxylesterase
MGAAIAEEYAVLFPEAVRALVLGSSAGGAAAGTSHEPITAHIDDPRQIYQQGMGAVFDRQVAMGLRPGPAETGADEHARARDTFAALSWAGFEHAGLALRTCRGTLTELARWHEPVLIVHGSPAAAPVAEIADDLHEAMPHARREMIHGSGQSPQREAQQAFNRTLLSFLSSI